MNSEDRGARLSKLRHDLRTPLNQIIGYSEMLQEDAPAELVSDLKRIHAAALTELAHVDEAIAVLTEQLTGEPAVRAAPVASAPSLAEESVHDGNGERLLVVDDDPANRDMLSRRLEKRGYGVDLAADGEQALRLIAERSYALVVLDIMMPGLSGIDVLRRVRQTHPMAELPIIMASAKDASDDVIAALGLGANDYVTKPINLPVLLARCRTQLEARRAHGFIRAVFGRYLTDEVVNALLKAPEALALGGEAREVTVLMSDLRGFSSMSERLAPAQVIGLLNVYLGKMTDVICAHGGTIDEFIGDAILVIFGAPVAQPDHARRALRCAVEMQRAMGEVNERLRAAGLPTIEMGVGINTGEVVVGNIGSERRAKYGVVGRHVNLASRIQAYSLGGEVLVSSSSVQAAGPEVRVESSLEVLPKGSDEPMSIYALGGMGALDLPRQTLPLVELPAPVAVRLRRVEGTDVTAHELGGQLTHLSLREARIIPEVRVKVPCTLRLELPGGGVFLKVRSAEQEGRLLVAHFTSMTRAAEQALSQMVTAAGARLAGGKRP